MGEGFEINMFEEATHFPQANHNSGNNPSLPSTANQFDTPK